MFAVLGYLTFVCLQQQANIQVISLTLVLVGKKLILICEKFPPAREMVGLVVGWGFIGHGRPRM